MRCYWMVFLLAAGAAFAQQQVVPKEFNAAQGRLFKKVTEAVSTPCCSNGIPVAYHDSGMAQFVRGEVIEAIKVGKSEDQIMAMLGEMKFGPKNDMSIIFTVPEKNLVGRLFWLAPLGALILGFLLIYYILRVSGHRGKNTESDDELIGRYRDFIKTRVDKLTPAK